MAEKETKKPEAAFIIFIKYQEYKIGTFVDKKGTKTLLLGLGND